MRIILAATFALGLSSQALADDLCPKYGECVPADQFDSQNIERSSLITHVCYNAANSYMIIRLKSTDYHYCSIDAGTVSEFLEEDLMGRFFNKGSKGSGSDARFDCRTHPVPTF